MWKVRKSYLHFYNKQRESMSRASRLGKNTLLVLVGNIGSKLISLVMLPLYTYWLSVEDFGLADLLSMYTTLLICVVTCCMAESLFIFPKGQEKARQREFFSSALVFVGAMLVLTALLCAGLSFVSMQYEWKDSFTTNIWLIYLLLSTQVFQQLFQQFTRSVDRMKVYSIAGIVLTVATALFAFLLIPAYGVKGYVYSLAAANLVAAAYAFVFSKSYSFFSVEAVKVRFMKQMLKYSVPLIPNGIMWWLVAAFNRPLMEYHNSFHEIGIFAVANKLPAIFSSLFGVFVTSWQISVLEEFEKEGYKTFYNKIMKMVFGFLILLLVASTVFSKLFIVLFADNKYYEAWRLVPLLALGAFFSSCSGFIGTNFSATRESKYYFYSSFWGAVAAVTGNFLLIPLWGIWGASIAVIVSFFVMAVTRSIYAWKYAPIHHLPHYGVVLACALLLIMAYIAEAPVLVIGGLTASTLLLLYLIERKELGEIYLHIKKRIK